jgi:hypothetical protein
LDFRGVMGQVCRNRLLVQTFQRITADAVSLEKVVEYQVLQSLVQNLQGEAKSLEGSVMATPGKKWTEIRCVPDPKTGNSALQVAIDRINAQQPPLQAGELVVVQRAVDEVFLFLFIAG